MARCPLGQWRWPGVGTGTPRLALADSGPAPRSPTSRCLQGQRWQLGEARGGRPTPTLPSAGEAGPPTLVMDAARTAERRGFRGFPTSKSSSSRSCGDTRLRPARGAAPPRAAPPQGLPWGPAPSPHPAPLPVTAALEGPGPAAGGLGGACTAEGPGRRYLALCGVVTGLLLGGEALVLLLGVVICGVSTRKGRRLQVPSSVPATGQQPGGRAQQGGGGRGPWSLPHAPPPRRAAQPGSPAVTSGDSEPTRDGGDRHARTRVPAQGALRLTSWPPPTSGVMAATAGRRRPAAQPPPHREGPSPLPAAQTPGAVAGRCRGAGPRLH